MKQKLPQLVQAILAAVCLGVLGAAWSTYMTAHDLQRDVATLTGKVDWLYRYTIPGHVEQP